MLPQARFRLKILFGPSQGQIFELAQDEFVIGRGEGSQISIMDPVVSRRHARIISQAGQYFIEDLGSANGTVLNGQALTSRQPLNPGDRITLGGTIVLEFDVQPAPPASSQAQIPYGQDVIGKGAPLTMPYEEDETYVSQPEESHPQIVITIAGQNSQMYSLQYPVIAIGRESDNGIIINSNVVSRHHARLEKTLASYQISIAPGNTNETYLDGQLITKPRLLHHNNVIRIGSQEAGSMVTMTYISASDIAAKKIQRISFETQSKLQVGRDPENDIMLPAPSVSRFHAQVERIGKRFRVYDLNSSNGTFVNNQRLDGDIWANPGDTIRIGPYRLVLGQDQLAQFDETSGLRVDAIGLNKWVRKDLNILENISLSFSQREFIVVVGQSGGGKTTLVDSIAGYRPATHGQVFVNDIDIYRDFDAIRSNIGYVPQRDIIHMELTVYQALDYAAKLRMPPDTSPTERHDRIIEVLSDLDLEHRKEVQISRLSGGQQKRVSIGVELLTKPGLFFLDEPTSGLDPGTETSFMQLMRRLADQGCTIVLITHATKNVMLADKVVFLARGGYLAWFGPPNEALSYFDQYRAERERRACPMDFDVIYSLLEDANRGQPQDWATRYQKHTSYQSNVFQPLSRKGYRITPSSGTTTQDRPDRQRYKPTSPSVYLDKLLDIDLFSNLHQFLILSARNLKILTRDRVSLFLMLAAAPIISIMDFILAGSMSKNPYDYATGYFTDVATSLFTLTIFGVLIGMLSQMREIVREGAIYKRERLVNLKILPYVLSKMWVAALLGLYQAAVFTIIHYLAFHMPGGFTEFGLIYITLTLATFAGMMLGLFASTLAPNSNTVPLIIILMLIPQIVLSGALMPLPDTITSVISSRWSLEALVNITGVGSDFAADPCWALPEEERKSLTNEDKETRGCSCSGINALNPTLCEFPGLGRFYDPAIDQPEPVEPAPIGEPPEKPAFPDPPQEPVDKNDPVAMNNYIQAMKEYQESVDHLQASYESQVQAYQSQVDKHQQDLLKYQEDFAEWQLARNGAMGKAEQLLARYQSLYGWMSSNKEDDIVYSLKITKTWLSQAAIITVLFFLILILMKAKDKVK